MKKCSKKFLHIRGSLLNMNRISDFTLKLSYRLISRAILVPFKEVCDRSAEDQDALDIELDEAMKDAQGAAGLIIGLGNDLVQNR